MLLVKALYLQLALCFNVEVRSDTAAPVLYEHLDQPPVFPGGEQALTAFINKNKRWPANSDICFEGRVFVSFIIETNGRTSNIKTVNKALYFFDKVNTQLIAGMPAWTPGKVNGEAVRTLMCIPVTYRLEY